MKLAQLLLRLTQSQMSKKGSGNKNVRKCEPNPPVEVKSPINTAKNGDYLISIEVRPGAKVSSITEVSPDVVSLQICAPPVDGEANLAIMKFFAEVLKLKKTQIDLRGGKSRQKTIVVSSKNVSPTSILDILKTNVGEKY